MTLTELNDKFRTTLQGGKVLMTQGVSMLDEKDQRALMLKVMSFNDFTEDNDPYGEHDFGSVRYNGTTYFWKIDYYDNNLEYASEDPEDETKTTRVLTVMRADEY